MTLITARVHEPAVMGAGAGIAAGAGHPNPTQREQELTRSVPTQREYSAAFGEVRWWAPTYTCSRSILGVDAGTKATYRPGFARGVGPRAGAGR